jgi:NAD(P)H-hydrate epimerase
MIPKQIKPFLEKIELPAADSHKGQNGKLLIIGGSQLFHAASKWSLDIASKFVDMVFYSSVPSNNQLILEAKSEFWNGIVIPRDELEHYVKEADCILIGPGMERADETKQVVNDLLKKYPDKKWVLDAGALQMVNPGLLKANHVITPHSREMAQLEKKLNGALLLATVLLKGEVDVVKTGQQEIKIEGGNAGMTKGGTGDVLAGLVAALYCTHDALTSCVVGSYINKKAGDKLFEQAGYYFNASDLVKAVPTVFWQTLQEVNASES